jgi:hypothetical protein
LLRCMMIHDQQGKNEITNHEEPMKLGTY